MAVQVADVLTGGGRRGIVERGTEPDAPVADSCPCEGIVIVRIGDHQLEVGPRLGEQQFPRGFHRTNGDVVQDDGELGVSGIVAGSRFR